MHRNEKSPRDSKPWTRNCGRKVAAFCPLPDVGRAAAVEESPHERSGLGGWSRKRLEFFAGLEAHGFARRNVNLLSGPRVASDAGLARLHIEHAEAAQFDAPSMTERIFHRFENGLDSLLRLCPGNIGFGYDSVDDVELDHDCLRESTSRPELHARQGVAGCQARRRVIQIGRASC